MKLLKLLMALALCAAILIGSVISTGAAGSYFFSEGFYYGIDREEAYVHSYVGEESDVVIREKFRSYFVTAIEEFAFFRNTAVKTLSFYDATKLNSLGQCAFAECDNLQYVEIPSSVQEMGSSVFDSCTSLTYVRFRDGAAASIPSQAFFNCSSLETVIFENDVTDIGAYAFANCSSLTKIDIPDSVESIADNAFFGCDDLVIYCRTNSYAMFYAIEHDIDYVLTDAPPVIRGDADGDGEITILDVTVIMRVIAELPVETFNEKAADVSGSGLDIIDATCIQRFLACLDEPYQIGEIIDDNVSLG